MKKLLIPLMLLGASALAESAPVSIVGAGATFPFPIYSKWNSEFKKVDPKVEINYQSIGSGGGIRQFTDKTVDFGASDAPMSDEQIAKIKPGVLHIPTVLGAVVITYNLPGVTAQLKLTGDTIANIYLGKITKWDDKAIAETNPGIKLPSTSIIVTYRSDGSGTTAVFTDYLSKLNPEWKTAVGQGPSVKWKIGLGGKGNEGVTGLVKQTPGAIGYVELIYAEQNKLPHAQLKNLAGDFVTASADSVSKAAAGALKDMPKDYRVSITQAAGKGSYPISAFTYLLVSTEMKGEKGKAFVKYLNWMLAEGQKSAAQMGYAPLPASLNAKVKLTVKSIKIQ